MAMDFCITMDLHHVELEGDSLVVVQDLKNVDINWSRYGQLIEDVKINHLELYAIMASGTC